VSPEAEQAAYEPPIARGGLRAFTQRHATLACVLLLCLATFGLYGRSLRNGFVNYDDPVYLTKNLVVQKGLTWSGVRWAFASTSAANWHPLTWMSHMADVQLFGLHPAGHHLHNNILHTLNVVLLFLLLWRSTGSRAKSALTAALFAVHPLNVESVAWIAERKSLLSTLFLLLALAAYGWYVQKTTIGRYSVVALCFACGLMAKPMVVTFPFCLLLLDHWPLNRLEWPSSGNNSAFRKDLLALIVEKIPLFVMSAASAVITVYAQRRGGAVELLTLLPMGQRFRNAIYSYVKYLVKGIWPSDLAVFYPHPEGSLALWRVVGAAGVLLLISVMVWRHRQRRYLVVGWLWYLGTMIPVIGIVQVGLQAMADRYAYLPFWGLFVIAVWIAAELFPRRLPTLKVGIAAATLSCFAIVTYAQIGYWLNGYTLFLHASQATPDNAIAEGNLGTSLADMGQLDQAEIHLMKAIRLTPGDLPPHYTLGMVFQRQNRPDDAQREYHFVIANSSDPVELSQSHNNLGVLFSQKDQLDDALREFNAAIRINPNEQNSFLGRGSIKYRRGEADAAIEDFRHAAQIVPSATVYFWLGSACELKRDTVCAAQAYEDALRLSPGLREAQNRLKMLQGKKSN